MAVQRDPAPIGHVLRNTRSKSKAKSCFVQEKNGFNCVSWAELAPKDPVQSNVEPIEGTR